jgi:hypothetical protein
MKNLSLYTKSTDDNELPLITAYFDESGHSASTRVVCMAGAVGPPSSWTRVREEWSAILAKHGVRVFHMADFENRFGEFEGWNDERRHALLSELLAVLDNTMLISVGTAVLVEDFENLESRTRAGLMDPWYLCLQMCLTDVAQTVLIVTKEELWDTKRCAVFLEHQSEFWRAPLLFSQMLEREAFAERIRIFGYATKQSCVKVYLADLIAYELRKHVENCLFDPNRPTRWPMKQLLKRPYLANVFDQQDRSLKIGPSGMVVFRNVDTAQLNRGGKILYGQNYVDSRAEEHPR